MAGNLDQEKNFHKFLDMLNVSTLAEARNLSSSVLQAANELQVRNGTRAWTYGRLASELCISRPTVILTMWARASS